MFALGCALCGCGGDHAPPYKTATAEHPNILFIVWDTVRADRLSLYGHDRQTTPFLDQWAKKARVYDHCVTVAPTTVPSHASMFTGLMPSEHAISNEPGTRMLPNEVDTLAEMLKTAGYDTFAFIANPYLDFSGKAVGVLQGFDIIEYPWDDAHRADAIRITCEKVMPYDRTNILAGKIAGRQPLSSHNIKACGELAAPSLIKWLENRASERPYLAFLNYMEAHAPLIPPLQYRRRFMNNEQIPASYKVNRQFEMLWRYAFGYHEYTPEENELTGMTYDAALLEEDEILHQLLADLEAKGYLRNTLVVLVGDHGEHLGEHHRLDHQFSVYEQLLHVPLVIYDPARFKAGREPRPVMNVDLFPTLLERVGLRSPIPTRGVNLLDPPEQRVRLSEYLNPMTGAFRSVTRDFPDFDPRPWNRTLRAYYERPYKLIEGSDGRNELYDLTQDPGESRNLIDEQPEVARRMLRDLSDYLKTLHIGDQRPSASEDIVPPEKQHMLKILGYVDSDEDAAGPASRPAPESGPATSQPGLSNPTPASRPDRP